MTFQWALYDSTEGRIGLIIGPNDGLKVAVLWEDNQFLVQETKSGDLHPIVLNSPEYYKCVAPRELEKWLETDPETLFQAFLENRAARKSKIEKIRLKDIIQDVASLGLPAEKVTSALEGVFAKLRTTKQFLG